MAVIAGCSGNDKPYWCGANTGIRLLINGEVNPNDVIFAYWTGAFTAGTGLWGTMGVNASSGAASGLGYGVGKLIQLPLDKALNPMKEWKDWIWVDVGMGISKPLPLDPLPGVVGNIFGSGSTEVINDQTNKKIIEIQGGK